MPKQSNRINNQHLYERLFIINDMLLKKRNLYITPVESQRYTQYAIVSTGGVFIRISKLIASKALFRTHIYIRSYEFVTRIYIRN